MTRVLSVLFMITLFAAPMPAAELQRTASDGVRIAPDGTPDYATFSIAAVDPETGEAAVAVTTRVPFVGRAVPWVRAGVGAVATQAWTVVEYGRQGLDLLEQGVDPQSALERLLADDAGRERRQVGIIDMKGRTAAHTGKENGEWAGSRQGRNYTLQGNILIGPEVLDAVAAHLDSSDGTGMPLAERLILALEAGQKTGGDRRWGLFQSAAIRVADPNNPGRGGDNISLAIEVGEHEEPVGEMKRIYYRTARRLGFREFSEVRGPDVIELKRMLNALGYWRPEMKTFPEAPQFKGDAALMRNDPAAYQKIIDEYSKRAREYDERFALYDAEAMEAVDRFRKEHGMEYTGNARGLVDERFVERLRAEFYGKGRAGGEERNLRQ